ncbi:reverse transcriptase domain-containing protein [Tanacetum coccineum]
MFQQTLDGKARAWFDKLPSGSIDNWGSLQEKFLNRFGMLKACDKDPTKISKITRKANETLAHFKGKVEMSDVSEALLRQLYPNGDEMLTRGDDYLRSARGVTVTRNYLEEGNFQRRGRPRCSGLQQTRSEANGFLTETNRVVLEHRREAEREKGITGKLRSKKAKSNKHGPKSSTGRKRKTTMRDEGWMNVPITFLPVPARDLLEEPLVIEAEVEGYLVRRIHIDEGASIEIMFEHCFQLAASGNPKQRLVETQTTVWVLKESLSIPCMPTHRSHRSGRREEYSALKKVGQ